ncbi:hypothetical protein ACIGHG_20170 [Bacillus sp. NPDC077411]|uniref:hypothetical protein n=1 Tax=Bacillus sp. NPDC077411 TaxID=3363947 RepID=UPI0037C89A77
MFVKEYKGCIDQGCSDKELLKVCGVAAVFVGGTAMSHTVTLVQKCMEELRQQKH